MSSLVLLVVVLCCVFGVTVRSYMLLVLGFLEVSDDCHPSLKEGNCFPPSAQWAHAALNFIFPIIGLPARVVCHTPRSPC